MKSHDPTRIQGQPADASTPGDGTQASSPAATPQPVGLGPVGDTQELRAIAVAAVGWTAGTDGMLAVLRRHTGAAGFSAAAAFEQAAAVAAGRLATAVAVISAEYAADTARIDFPAPVHVANGSGTQLLLAGKARSAEKAAALRVNARASTAGIPCRERAAPSTVDASRRPRREATKPGCPKNDTDWHRLGQRKDTILWASTAVQLLVSMLCCCVCINPVH